MLSTRELERYNRQMRMGGWGETTQQKLKGSRVFIAGAGGLGSPAAIYLAVAGVGHITICDSDSPELTNLNRQILHDHTRIGMNKATSGKRTLELQNPDISITAVTDRITARNVDDLVGEAEVILDCLDNYPARFLLNETAIRKRVPLVHGSVWGMEGRLAFLRPPETPCLRCLFAEAPPAEVFPVLGATPGVIGCLQALETIKFLTGIGRNLEGRLLVWDGNQMEFRHYKVRKDPNCEACGGL